MCVCVCVLEVCVSEKMADVRIKESHPKSGYKRAKGVQFMGTFQIRCVECSVRTAKGSHNHSE